jgi:hypothetical protein
MDDRALRYAAALFAVGVVVHNADHVRRGTDSLTPQLTVAGWGGLAISVVAIALVFFRHRLAPVVAVAAGFPLALGFVAAHWLPTWSVFSDSFVEGGVRPVTQAASLLEIVAALALGAAGLAVLRSRARTGHRSMA